MPDTLIPYSARIDKLKASAREVGAKLCLIDHGELMGWLTGYQGTETMYRALLVPLEGEPWLVLRGLDAPQAERHSWLTEIIGFKDWEDPHDQVSLSIIDHGYSSAKILVDDASYSFTVYAQNYYLHIYLKRSLFIKQD